MNLSEIDLNDIDINDIKKIGTAPAPVKAALIVVVCIAAAAAGYFLDTTKQLDELKKAKAEEITLRNTFVEKNSTAVNLEAYKQQLEEMRSTFGALLRQLPNSTEIETLLTDISQTGISSGLEIEYFKPEGLRPKEFYAEYPIKLKVTGRYHEFADFVSGVAALPRIVTLQDIAILPAQKEGGSKLIMDITAITYQYLDESAQEQ
ncbi:MAG: type 4a pilus biogenesis protein PilO [Gammaproteobacteria bacterium]|jgi:type IV pilus assembly protein PilO|nr:type 4a pilus biogenesis protein PilO [Gammaproteobacteria bacterium]